MLGYLSKFVLQMLPTISATVIGAYIVTTWINPKSPAESAKIAAVAPRQQTAKAAHPNEQPAQDAQVQPGHAASGDAVDTAPAKATGAPDSIRMIPIVKQPSPSQETTVNTSAPAAPAVVETTAIIDERKDANTLARAAILRQRGNTETTRAADDAAKPVTSASRPQQARVVPDAQGATVAPPLPPAVTIGTRPSPQGEGAALLAADRPSPPAEIPPIRNPLSLQALHRVADNPSPADDFLNATRSFFRALSPQ
jgi:hypothetical protein